VPSTRNPSLDTAGGVTPLAAGGEAPGVPPWSWVYVDMRGLLQRGCYVAVASWRRRVAAWVLATLALTGWFLFSARYLYGLLPREVIREALWELARTAMAEDVWGKAWAIFTNNIRLLLLAALPVVGVLVELLGLFVTASVGRYAAELLAGVAGGSWETYFYRFIVLTPFFPLELLAYGIAVAEGLLLLWHRSLRRYLVGVAVAVAVLAIAAVVEAVTITYMSPLPGLGG